jgi:hypothetical protein
VSRRFRVAVELRGSPDPESAAAALVGAGLSPMAEGRIPVCPVAKEVATGVELTYRVVTDEDADEFALERIAGCGLHGPGVTELWLWSVRDLGEAAQVAADDLWMTCGGELQASALRLVVEPSLPRNARAI